MDNWTIVFITLTFSAFFSGMEIAFVSSNRLKIEVDKSKGVLSARIMSKFNTIPSKFIGALLLGNNIALVVYGIAMAALLKPFINKSLPVAFNNETITLLLQTIIATLIVLFVAEFLPKVLFKLNSNKILNFFAIPIFVFFYIFYPIIYIYIGLSEFILKRFVKKIDFSKEDLVFNTIDLDHYFREFSSDLTKHGEVQQEIQMFQNAIDFRNLKLRECMVPRTEIVALEENEDVAKLRDTFIASGHSKIPVFRESIDNIIGYTHSSDIFKQPKTIKAIARQIIVVPETMPANVVLSMFIKQNKSIAVVVDEFGGTSGIITMEDVIEEIFGEINDEFDVEDLTEKKISNNEYIFSARLEIDYLNEKYQLNLPVSESYETLAGFIINNCQSIPELNDTIQIKSYSFAIIEATKTRVEKVKLVIE
ncbi:MAG: hemolysin [Bacteroidetes bacterium 4484_276]|nr:MAG: hemolysin [Bacteroidetes bacterium 4484_276]